MTSVPGVPRSGRSGSRKTPSQGNGRPGAVFRASDVVTAPAGPRVSAGTATAVFQPAGAEPVVTHPVPAKTVDEAREQLDRTVARKSAAKGQCEHRVKSGAYCKECGRLI